MTVTLRSGRPRSDEDGQAGRSLAGPQGTPLALGSAPVPLFERLGIQASPGPFLLELEAPVECCDHTGGVHAAVQFALAEAAAGHYLSNRFSRLLGGAAAIIRESEVRFNGPVRGKLYARSRASRDAEQRFTGSLRSRSRAVITVATEVVDSRGAVSLTAVFHCLVTREQPG